MRITPSLRTHWTSQWSGDRAHRDGHPPCLCKTRAVRVSICEVRITRLAGLVGSLVLHQTPGACAHSCTGLVGSPLPERRPCPRAEVVPRFSPLSSPDIHALSLVLRTNFAMHSFLPAPSSHSSAPGAPGRRRRPARPPRPPAHTLRHPFGHLTSVARQHGRALLAAMGLLFLLWTLVASVRRRGGGARAGTRLTVHGYAVGEVRPEHRGGAPGAVAPGVVASASTAAGRRPPAVKASVLELQEKWATDDDAAEAEEEVLRAIVAGRRERAAKRQGRGGRGATTRAKGPGKSGTAVPDKFVHRPTAGQPGGSNSDSGLVAPSGHVGVQSGRVASSVPSRQAAVTDGAAGMGKRRASPLQPPLRAAAAGERLADLPETDNGDLAMQQGGARVAAAAASSSDRVAGWPPVRRAAPAEAAAEATTPTSGGTSVPAAAVAAAAVVPPAVKDEDEEDLVDEPPFHGVPLSAVDASAALLSDVVTHTNLTRLSYMMYRLVITTGATSLLDVPCTSHAAWMPPLLARLDFEVPGFEYTCMDAVGELPRAAATAVSCLSSAAVLLNISYWAANAPPLPRVDLVWSWGGLEGLFLDDAYSFFQRVHASGSGRLAVGNWPRLNNVVVGGGGHYHGRPALGRPLPPAMNLRGSPFLFGQAERVIGGLDDAEANSGNTVEGRPTRKQLLVYDTRKMRESW